MAESIDGVLERILFQNEENGYLVGEFTPKNQRQTITIAGEMSQVQCGETLTVSGKWIQHPQYGSQFKVSSHTSRLPNDVYGLKKYLGSGLIPGIGAKYADKIVDKFGKDTLSVISNETMKLQQIPGIGKERAKKIKAAWEEQEHTRGLMIFLQKYSIPMSVCRKLVNTYGTEAAQLLKTDPYKIARKIRGIGFMTADKIALNIGFSNDSLARLRAGLLYFLETESESGHTAVPVASLLEIATEKLQVEINPLRAALQSLIDEKDIEPVPQEQQVQLARWARMELAIARTIADLQSSDSCLPPIKVPAALDWIQEQSKMKFAPEQLLGIQTALSTKISILTGGPGTGKTTVLRSIVKILRAKKVKMVLVAPTGRAAQRMSETTYHYAQTIHRLLKPDPASGNFAHNQKSPLKLDYLIIDEASMLDTSLAHALFTAIPPHAHVLIVGDADQLPSVGAGTILQDLIESNLIPYTALQRIFRQKQGNSIVKVAYSIRHGNAGAPEASEVSQWENPGLHLLPAKSPEETIQHLDAVTDFLQKESADNFDQQLLSPIHRGSLGISALNQFLQEKLNPRGASTSFTHKQFRIGDKVIQTRNQYDLNLFNGDLGVIRDHPNKQSLVVQFEREEKIIEDEQVNDLELAYALSIHKSQGSEFPNVIVVLSKQHFVMLQRNLLYTAITRGKKRVFAIADPQAWAMAVQNQTLKQRITNLQPKMKAIEA